MSRRSSKAAASPSPSSSSSGAAPPDPFEPTRALYARVVLSVLSKSAERLTAEGLDEGEVRKKVAKLRTLWEKETKELGMVPAQMTAAERAALLQKGADAARAEADEAAAKRRGRKRKGAAAAAEDPDEDAVLPPPPTSSSSSSSSSNKVDMSSGFARSVQTARPGVSLEDEDPARAKRARVAAERGDPPGALAREYAFKRRDRGPGQVDGPPGGGGGDDDDDGDEDEEDGFANLAGDGDEDEDEDEDGGAGGSGSGGAGVEGQATAAAAAAAPAAAAAEAPEEEIALDEMIGSDLDSDSDESTGGGADEARNVILCQYEKVKHVKGRWRLKLKAGLAQLDKKEYVFSSAECELSFHHLE